MVDARAVAVLENWDSTAYKFIKQNNKVWFFYLKTRALFLNGTDKLYTVCKKPLPYLMYEWTKVPSTNTGLTCTLYYSITIRPRVTSKGGHRGYIESTSSNHRSKPPNQTGRLLWEVIDDRPLVYPNARILKSEISFSGTLFISGWQK